MSRSGRGAPHGRRRPRAHRAPIVAARGAGDPERGRDDRKVAGSAQPTSPSIRRYARGVEVWKCGSSAPEIPRAAPKSSSLPMTTSTERRRVTVHASRRGRTAPRPPQRLAEVQVEGDDGAGPVGGLDGLGRERRRGRDQPGEDAAGVQPASAVRSPKMASQSTSPGRSWEAAELARSEQPTAPRTPKPRSVKFSPLRTEWPMPSYGSHARYGWCRRRPGG